MDWSKVDAALAGALADAGDRRLPVFVHLDAERADRALLAGLQVLLGEAGGVCTAHLSGDQVALLTDQSWVTGVRLSGPLLTLGDG